MDRFDAIVIGPGLGRDELVHETVKQVICILFLKPSCHIELDIAPLLGILLAALEAGFGHLLVW